MPLLPPAVIRQAAEGRKQFVRIRLSAFVSFYFHLFLLAFCFLSFIINISKLAGGQINDQPN